MKKWEKYTVIFLVVAVVAIVIYDYIALGSIGTEGTLSFNITEMSHKFPAVPFGFGFLAGHLFWRTRDVAGKTDKWGR